MYDRLEKPAQKKRAIANNPAHSRKGSNTTSIRDDRPGPSFQQTPTFQKEAFHAPLQFAMGGSYEETDKSDAHHMPSARAIAAIVEVNKDSNKQVSDCHTLAVNEIYRGAPAVWMFHDDHTETRTFGGRSTGALTQDFDIIKKNNAETAFTKIQQKDIEDFKVINGNSKKANNKGLEKLEKSGATSNTIGKVQKAISNKEDVMAVKSDNTMIPIASIQDAANSIWTIKGGLKEGVNFIEEITGEKIAYSTLSTIANGEKANVQQRVGNAIRLAFDALPKKDN